MSLLTDTWRQLVRRRLWPVALLLAAAAAAVPVLLAKEPEAVSPPAAPAPATSTASELSEAPIVTASTTSSRAAGRKLLGRQRDIFKSTAKKPKPEKPAATAKGSQSTGDTSPEQSGGSAPSSPVAPSPSPYDPVPVPGPSAPKPKTYEQHSLTVRFGSADGDLSRTTVPRMQALPSEAQPLLIYLGLREDRKTAVFLLDASATAQGDGECHPTPESCETVRLRAGETEFIDVVDAAGNSTAQFQLDLVKIHKSETTDGAKASKLANVASLRRDASAGASTLRRLGVVTRTG